MKLSLLNGFENFVFDLDGVISNTASIHALAWKDLFDIFFLKYQINKEFDLKSDYRLFFDGISRIDAIKKFISIFNIDLELGNFDDFNYSTIYGLSNLKNDLFLNRLKNVSSSEIVFDDSLVFLEHLQELGKNIYLASSSKNAIFILEKANMLHYFNSICDGNTIEENNLKPKPSSDIFNFCIKSNFLCANKTIVFEDSISGINAGLSSESKGVVVIDRYSELVIDQFNVPIDKLFLKISSFNTLFN